MSSFTRRRMLLLSGLGGVGLLGGIGAGVWGYFARTSQAVAGSPSPAAANPLHPTLLYIGGVWSPFYQMIGKGAREEATKQGVTLQQTAPSRWDAGEQSALVHAAIARGVQAILIAPCDGQALIAPLTQARQAGIPVVTVDTTLGNGDYERGPVTFPVAGIGSDNLEGGRQAAEALLSLLGNTGKIYVQSTAPGTSATDQREQGFKAALPTAPGVQLVGTGYDHGDIALATQQTALILAQHPDLAGIFGTGDYSTTGAMVALEQAGKTRQVKVVRFDASEEAISDLRAGTIDLIISQQPASMGQIAVQDALCALQGRDAGLARLMTTRCVRIDRENMNTPEAQAAIYR